MMSAVAEEIEANKMLTDLFIHDKTTGETHRIGDNQHDSLSVIDGRVVYENLQNGEGTYSGKGDYEFVESEYGER
jgi:hypothetical protein